MSLAAAILTDITQAAGAYCEFASLPGYARLWVSHNTPDTSCVAIDWWIASSLDYASAEHVHHFGCRRSASILRIHERATQESPASGKAPRVQIDRILNDN